jgi:hypothetical protein
MAPHRSSRRSPRQQDGKAAGQAPSRRAGSRRGREAGSQGRRRSMEDDGMILSRSCEVVSLCGRVRVCGLREGIRAAVILGGEVGRTNEYGPFDIRE